MQNFAIAFEVFFYSAAVKTKSSNCFMNFINRHIGIEQKDKPAWSEWNQTVYTIVIVLQNFLSYKSVIVLAELSLNVHLSMTISVLVGTQVSSRATKEFLVASYSKESKI
jgi:hypothetical protein